jgi:hypothetical protein
LLRRDSIAGSQGDQVCLVKSDDRASSGSYLNLFTAGASGRRGDWFVLTILGDRLGDPATLQSAEENQKPGVMIQKLAGVRLAHAKQGTSSIAKPGTLCCVLSPKVLASAATPQK